MNNDRLVATAAEAVREAIRRSGLSVADVSRRAGISYASLRRKIAGDTPFRVSELFFIAEVTDVKPSALIAGESRDEL